MKPKLSLPCMPCLTQHVVCVCVCIFSSFCVKLDINILVNSLEKLENIWLGELEGNVKEKIELFS